MMTLMISFHLPSSTRNPVLHLLLQVFFVCYRDHLWAVLLPPYRYTLETGTADEERTVIRRAVERAKACESVSSNDHLADLPLAQARLRELRTRLSEQEERELHLPPGAVCVA